MQNHPQDSSAPARGPSAGPVGNTSAGAAAPGGGSNANGPGAPEDQSGGPATLVGERFEVEVGPVAHGGHCVARTAPGPDGRTRVLFVRHTLPGERVVALVTDGNAASRFLRADAVEILAPSKDRITAPCPFSGPGRCGGCDWQHASPGARRRLKAEVVTEQLARLAGLTPQEAGWDGRVEPHPDDKVPAGEVPAWRTRVQYAVDPGTGRAGLRRHRSHDVEPVDRCLIAAPGVRELGVEAVEWPETAAVEAISATGSSDRQVIITPAPGGRLPLVSLNREVSVLRVDEQGGVHRVHGRGFVRERAAGRTWRVSSGGFWQVHPAAPDTLVAAVLDGLAPRPEDTAIDLYCGVGLFAGVLAERVRAVLGVESSKRSVEDARHNLGDLENVRIEHGKVERVLPRTGITETDLVVLDPPRAGAGREVVDRVASLGPRRIAYVACDPAALARDLAFFAADGYRPVSLRALDLFPVTHHVECVAILEPAGKSC